MKKQDPSLPIFANARLGKGTESILGLRIRILAEAYQRLITLIKECPHEISGFGRAVEDAAGYLITDIAVLHQEAGAVHTEIEPEDAEKFMLDLLEKNDDPSLWRVWWHSHVDMAAIFSSIDTDTMNKLFPEREIVPWAISIVGNKRGEFSVRYDLYKPRRIALEELPLEVAFGETAAAAEQARADIQTFIRKPRYAALAVYKGGKKKRGWVDRITDTFLGSWDGQVSESSAGSSEPTEDVKLKRFSDANLEVWNRVNFEARRAIVGAWQDEVEELVKIYGLNSRVNEIYESAAQRLNTSITYLRSSVLEIGCPTRRAFGQDGKYVWAILSVVREMTEAVRGAERESEGAAESAAPEVTMDEFRRMSRKDQEQVIDKWMEELYGLHNDCKIEAREIADLAQISEAAIQRHFDRCFTNEWRPNPKFAVTIHPALIAARLIAEERKRASASAETEMAGHEEPGEAAVPAEVLPEADAAPAPGASPEPEVKAGQTAEESVANGEKEAAVSGPLDELTLAEYNELSLEMQVKVIKAWYARLGLIWERLAYREMIEVCAIAGISSIEFCGTMSAFRHNKKIPAYTNPRQLYAVLQATLNIKGWPMKRGEAKVKEVRK